MSAKRVKFEPLRTLASGGISAMYAAVGSALASNPRLICITNLTQGIMIFSFDNTITEGQIVVPAGSFKLFDLTTNQQQRKDDNFVIRKGDILYVKQATAPTMGSVYFEVIHA